MKTLGDEWYAVIKVYKLTVFDILRDFFVLPYIACPRYPYIRVYRLYDYVHTIVATSQIPNILFLSSLLETPSLFHLPPHHLLSSC